MNEAAPAANPNAMAADPTAMGMGADPTAMAADPNAMAANPSAMTADPTAMGVDQTAMVGDPNAMADETLAGMEENPESMGMDENPEDDMAKKEIESKTGELSQLLNTYKTPDEELDKYVKGMVDSALNNRMDLRTNDEEAETEAGAEDPTMGGEQQMPVESVTFSKGQLKRLHEATAMLDSELESDKPKRTKKRKSSKGKTPFNPPSFK